MRKSNDIIRILTVVLAVMIAALVIGGGTYLLTASKKIRAIQIQPTFQDTELGVLSSYTFNVDLRPEKASVKKIKAVCEDPNSTFELSKDGVATLITGPTEGTVTVYLEYKDIKSNALTFQIVDQAAREAAQAAADAAAAAEAAAVEEAPVEEAPVQTTYVMMTGDNVNIRSQNNTDCEVLGKAKKGDTFEKVEDVDDWTHIIYNGQDGYIKTEYLTDASNEESSEETTEAAAQPAAEEKKPEADAQAQAASQAAAEASQAATAAAEAAQAEAAAAAAQQLAEAQAAAAQAAAAQAAAAVGTPIACKDGTCYVTPAQLQKIHATWDFAGDAIEMAGHHSIGELEAVIGPTQH